MSGTKGHSGIYIRTKENTKNMYKFPKGIIPWNKGKTDYLSDESRKKMGAHDKGFKKGYTPWNKGVETPLEIKKILSEALRGEKSHLWKGGVDPLNHAIRSGFNYRQWRSDIFFRDNFTCKHCGVRGGQLHAHHIKEFYKIREENNIKTLEDAFACEELWNINNGITLCIPCHKEYHKTFK
jgi:hypothetical protein